MALSSTPIPLSRIQILGNMLDSFSASQGITRLKVGGPILSTFEAASQSDAKQIAVVLQSLQARDLDAIQGQALDSYGNSNGVPRLQQRTAKSTVNVIDTSFTKVQGQISPAAPAPIVGSNTIYVTRSDDWLQAPTSGSIYLGRGLTNYEGPIAYTDITDNGTYLTFSLTTPTTQFHNQGEGVTRAQGGNRNIGAGTIVSTAQGAITTAVQFTVLYQYTLPDGEVEVDGLEVICNTPGTAGNVPAGAISQFQGSPPFTGATVTNPNSISNGQDVESNEDYRTRIKQEKANPQRGTDQAIINSVVGLQDSLGETISSASIVRKNNGLSTLFIDDGTGYEETSDGIGIEVLVNSAVGGETEFQSVYHQIAKAFSVSRNSSPYNLNDGCVLSVLIGGVESSHTFSSNEFLAINSASAYEIVASINGDPTILFSARTIDSGTRFAIESRSEMNEDVEITPTYIGEDANYVFQFPISRYYTTSLYKNDKWLSKDGQPAIIYSQNFSKWNVLIGSQTLLLAIDQTPPTSYTFDDDDFINYSKGFNTLGTNSLAAWAAVFNNRLPGITTKIVNDQLVFSSNKGNSSLAQISVLGGTLVDNGMFLPQIVLGENQDYILDRATGKFLLTVPLVQGDKLTLGSNATRPFLETPRFGSVSLVDSIRMWLAIDSSATIKQNGITPGTSIVPTVSGISPTTYQISLTVSTLANPFLNVEEGDWMVFYDNSGEIGGCPESLKHAYKVAGISTSGSNYSVVIEKPEAKVPRYESAIVTLQDGRVMVIGGKTSSFDSSSVNLDQPGSGTTDTCEIFTAVSNTVGSWVFASNLLTPRSGHTATVLLNGKVLVFGGRDGYGNILDSTEIYDPSTNTWTAGSPLSVFGQSYPKVYHTANLLTSGRVLITGGISVENSASVDSFEYDPATGGWVHQSAMHIGRYKHASIGLAATGGTGKNGFVLVAGGTGGTGPLKSTELYNPSTYVWAETADMPSERECFSLVQPDITSNKVMAVGSSSRISGSVSTYSIYSISSNTWGTDLTISQQLLQASGVTVSFINSRIGTLYNSSLGTWTLVMPYASIPSGSVCLAWNSTDADWEEIAYPLSLGTFDGNPKQDILCAELGDSYGTNSQILFFGGYEVPMTSTFNIPRSTHEVLSSGTWNYPSDSIVDGGFTLSNTTNLVFVKSTNPLSYLEIPSGDYISNNFVSSLNSKIEGVVASVYRTSALRLATANFWGDLLIAANSNKTILPFLEGILVKAQERQNGTAISGSNAIGTPLDFTLRIVDCQEPPSVNDSVLDLSLNLSELPLGTSILMGLKPPSSMLAARSSNWQGYRATLATVTGLGQAGASYDSVRVGLRTVSDSELASGTPVVLASPLHIGPYDDFSVIVDKDPTMGLFNIPMARQVIPAAGTNYGTTVTLTETSGTSLASTFGLDYLFEDFAVYMKARVQTHPGDSTKAALWRFWRYGQDGESFALRYSYPTAPNSIVTATINHNQNTLDLTGAPRSTIDIVLGSGVLRSGSTLKTTTRLGLACNKIAGWTTGETYESYLIAGFKVASYSRETVGGVTVLTLTLPDGLANHGIQVNDVIYFNATNPSSTTLYSGPFTVSAVQDSSPNFTVTVPAGILCQANALTLSGSNPGTVSIDSGAFVKFDPAIQVNDLVYLGNNSYGSSPLNSIASYLETTMRIEEIGDTSQWLKCSFSNLSGTTPSISPIYSSLENPSQVQVFAGPSQQISQLVSAINILAGVPDSTIPITGTILGEGTGIINKASWDEQQTQAFCYPLTDGLNFVQKTIAPEFTVNNVQLLLKTPVGTNLTTNSDWANEKIFLVPQTTENVVEWFNSLTVTGLSSKAEIVNTVTGCIQITSLTLGSDAGVEILGGLSNSSAASVFGSMHINSPQDGYDASALITVKGSTATGFVANRWASINNTSPSPKKPLSVGGSINSIDSKGKIVCSACYSSYKNGDAQIEVRKIGAYTVVSFDSTDINAASIKATGGTGYIEIEPTHSLTGSFASVDLSNQGVYPILAFSTVGTRTSIWIENSSVTEETSYAFLNFLTYSSLVPGDTITINSNDFGVNNKGVWTVIAVGRTNLIDTISYQENSFWVDISSKVPQALAVPVVFTAANIPIFKEGLSRKALKKIASVSPNQTDGSYVDFKILDSIGILNCGQTVGTVVTALDKLDFPLGLNLGADSYRYNTGLLGAASAQIYGVPQDTTQGTGYVANGATVLVAGPKIKRIQVSLAIRATSQTQSTKTQIQAAVASFVNSVSQGSQIAFSDITEAAKISGVTAVSMVSPAYSSSNDVIPVAANEKPMILSASQDIQVSFVGS